MGQSVADQEILNFQLHIIACDLIEDLLGNFHFRCFTFNDEKGVTIFLVDDNIASQFYGVDRKRSLNGD